MPRNIFSALLLTTLLAGCAGQKESRLLAGQTAGLLNDYRREVDQFAQHQSTMNADNDARVRTFEDLRTRRQADTDRRIASLKAIKDERALALYQLHSATTLDQIQRDSAALKTLQPVPPSAKAIFDAAPVQALVKQLKAYQETPSIRERISGADDYYEALQTAYAASLETASANTDKAKESAAKLDNDTTKALATVAKSPTPPTN